MQSLSQLFENNRHWAEGIRKEDPAFFEQLAMNQSPGYLWIGCSDSRAPASQIVGVKPGELFVHRNIANVVLHNDLNCLSVLQYAVEALKIQHIIVCGHYDCGGIRAYLNGSRHGLIDNWLRAIHRIYNKHRLWLEDLPQQQRLSLLCELNTIEQVWNISQTTVLQNAWQQGQDLAIHGWMYRLCDGLLHDLDIHIDRDQDPQLAYEAAVTAIQSKRQD